METNELQDMREQLALLKHALEKEQITNDRLLREAMRGKVARIHRKGWVVGACVVYVLTFGLWSFYNMGMSWWLLGATVLLMLASLVQTLLIHRRFRTQMVMTEDLHTVAQAAIRLKKDYTKWLYIGLPASFLWLVWFVLEILFGNTIYAESPMGGRVAVAVVLVVAGCIGAIIGYMMHRRILKLCEEILRQIEQ